MRRRAPARRSSAYTTGGPAVATPAQWIEFMSRARPVRCRSAAFSGSGARACTTMVPTLSSLRSWFISSGLRATATLALERAPLPEGVALKKEA